MAGRGRPRKEGERRSVTLRAPLPLLERIKAHQARLQALTGVSVAQHDVLLMLITKGLDALDLPAAPPPVAGAPQSVPPLRTRRKDAISESTLRAIAAERRQYPAMSIRTFCQHLYATGVYRAEGKAGDAKPPSVSFIHRWLKEAEAAGLL